MYNFQSDYLEGCANEILEELKKVNDSQSVGYGMDEYCDKAKQLIKKIIDNSSVDVHFITGGTPCNTLAIASALRPFEAVISADTGHIAVHETGAIEATGHKVITCKNINGKIDPKGIIDICEAHTDEHMVKPRMVFVSNPSEYGTVYSLKELNEIKDICKKYNLLFYMDGARLSSALAIDNYDVTLKDLPNIFDMFYIGGTKNGALLGEAFVIVNDNLKDDFRYMIKQRGQMLAKGRILGISMYTLLKDDLHIKLAKNANGCANKLREVFAKYGVKEYIPSLTNQTFVILDNVLIEKLQNNYLFNIFDKYNDNQSVARFVTSWATKMDAIDQFERDLKTALE